MAEPKKEKPIKTIVLMVVASLIAIFLSPVGTCLNRKVDEYRTRNLINFVHKNAPVSVFASECNDKVPQLIYVSHRFYIENITTDKIVDLKISDVQIALLNANLKWEIKVQTMFEKPGAEEITTDKYIQIKPANHIECVTKIILMPNEKNQKDFFKSLENVGDIKFNYPIDIKFPKSLKYNFVGKTEKINETIFKTYNEVLEKINARPRPPFQKDKVGSPIKPCATKNRIEL